MLLSVCECVSFWFVGGLCEVGLLLSEDGDWFLVAAVPVCICVCSAYAV